MIGEVDVRAMEGEVEVKTVTEKMKVADMETEWEIEMKEELKVELEMALDSVKRGGGRRAGGRGRDVGGGSARAGS